MSNLFLHPAIEKALADLEKRRRNLLALSPHMSRVDRIANATVKNPNLFHYLSDSLCLSFDLDSYTDAIPALTALSKEGWRRKGKMQKNDQCFQWNLTYEVRPGLSIRMQIEGRPPELSDKSDSATCHRVRTGTKLIEVPEYEIVCNEPEAEPSMN